MTQDRNGFEIDNPVLCALYSYLLRNATVSKFSIALTKHQKSQIPQIGFWTGTSISKLNFTIDTIERNIVLLLRNFISTRTLCQTLQSPVGVYCSGTTWRGIPLLQSRPY